MSFVALHQDGPISRVRLNRPEVKNAFNDILIREFSDLLKKLEKDPKVRVVILSGEGDCFCAGADLNWMKSMKDASRKMNEADAKKLAGLLTQLNEFPKPTVAQVHGAVIGGGVGLVAACDVAVAAEETIFALAEVKLGLIPAVISPFVISKIGSSIARRYFLTGERFKADRAMRSGLIHEVVSADQLTSRCEVLVRELLTSGPEAIKACKELIRKVGPSAGPSVRDYTAKKIAALRVSPEGQEGMSSFLGKRKPSWNVS